MKNYVLVVALAATVFTSATSCSKDSGPTPQLPDQPIETGKLPVEAEKFIHAYLPGYVPSQVTVAPEPADNGAFYTSVLEFKGESSRSSIVLHNRVKISFDRSGQWIEIEHLTDKAALPESILRLLPTTMLQYLRQHHAGVGVHEVERKSFGYELEFVDGRELLFDRNGDFLDKAKVKKDTHKTISVAAPIESFIKAHFAGYRVAYVKVEGKHTPKTKVYIRKSHLESFKLVFDQQNQWIEVDADDSGRNPVPASVVALMPEQVSQTIAQRYAGRPVVSAEKRPTGYKVELYGDVELYFNLQGQLQRIDDESGSFDDRKDVPKDNKDYDRIAGALPQEAKAFLAKHFPNVYVRKIEPKKGDAFEVDLANGVEVKFDAQGQWIEVDGDDRALPASVAALLPEKIQTHLRANYASGVVAAITRNARGYKVELLYRGDDLEVFYSPSGDFISHKRD